MRTCPTITICVWRTLLYFSLRVKTSFTKRPCWKCFYIKKQKNYIQNSTIHAYYDLWLMHELQANLSKEIKSFISLWISPLKFYKYFTISKIL